MKGLFNDKMSSPEAQRIFFDYAAQHKGENIEAIKEEYREVSKRIVRRELKENAGMMTSYNLK